MALAWYDRTLVGMLAWRPDGIVSEILVHPHYRRQGVASALWAYVNITVPLCHDDDRTDDGEGWALAVGGAGSEPRRARTHDSGNDKIDIDLLKFYEEQIHKNNRA
jgi:GNAT superfamily N-acetyltransferase